MRTKRYFPLNKVRLPLFWKFAIGISFTVILFGTLNLLFIRYQVYRTFEAQIERSGLSIAAITAEELIDPMLYNEIAAVNKVLLQVKTVNPDIVYLLIVSPQNTIVASTFNKKPSQSLITANTLN